ncbi:MAG: hypothetical protein EZS28_016449 [Streblomastix strix]|uniref:Uncharacterized protein n=1 Tax=Streblomastix strix TaxID=222440 RepID=A0A5J4W0L1_9EUKA|nr:MAG: hypothetical protein EZS28_016449 [Streblomastix strix]
MAKASCIFVSTIVLIILTIISTTFAIWAAGWVESQKTTKNAMEATTFFMASPSFGAACIFFSGACILISLSNAK